VDGARDAIRLLQNDLVAGRNVRIEERLGRRACKGIDGLVVVAGREMAGPRLRFPRTKDVHPEIEKISYVSCR
jgi:hypothetical protein